VEHADPPGAYRRYLAALAAGLALFGALAGANALFLWRAWEASDVATIAARQRETGGLYGSALHSAYFQYKFALYDQAPPEVVALGSSRAMQFRAEMFRRPFLNLGGLMENPREGALVADALLARERRPRVALLTADFWWFNPDMPERRAFPEHAERGVPLSSDALLLPFRWLADGRLPARLYARTLLAGLPADADFPTAYGVRAETTRAGFTPDGAWNYWNLAYGFTPGDEGFAAGLGQIRRGSENYRHSRRFDAARWDEFVALVRRLNGAGIRVLVLDPPFAPAARAQIRAQAGDFAHLAEFRRRLATLTVPVVDAFDDNRIAPSNCEFLDLHHAGDVVAARLLLAASQQAFTGLNLVVDSARLAEMAAPAERALARSRWGGGRREVDFLNLGCAKD
jgi:hypothetical protein